MDPCYLIVATICFSPFELESARVERVDSSVLATVRYDEFQVELVSDDGGNGVTDERRRRRCTGAGCVTYTYSCAATDASEVCEFHFSRAALAGSVFLRVSASGTRLPTNWMEQIALLASYRASQRARSRVVSLDCFERTDGTIPANGPGGV